LQRSELQVKNPVNCCWEYRGKQNRTRCSGDRGKASLSPSSKIEHGNMKLMLEQLHMLCQVAAIARWAESLCLEDKKQVQRRRRRLSEQAIARADVQSEFPQLRDDSRALASAPRPHHDLGFAVLTLPTPVNGSTAVLLNSGGLQPTEWGLVSQPIAKNSYASPSRVRSAKSINM
jgi:hypothetical protein